MIAAEKKALEAIAGELAGRLTVIVVLDAIIEDHLNADGTDDVSSVDKLGMEAQRGGR